MIFDCHTHTKFSADSTMGPRYALEQAEKLGLGIIFTDHYDFDFPDRRYNFTFDATQYFKEYEPLRRDGSRLRLGVEIGMTENSREANKTFVKQGKFDMVIGSIHLINNVDIYNRMCYEGYSKDEIYREYFRVMADEAANQDFDTLGHIDYIARAATFENPEIDYGTFHDEIDLVLKTIIDRGILLELNTRRLDSIRGMKELVPVFTRYRDLGGKYVTIGSDAHKVSAIGNYFDRAMNLISSIGLSPAVFNRRELQPI